MLAVTLDAEKTFKLDLGPDQVGQQARGGLGERLAARTLT